MKANKKLMRVLALSVALVFCSTMQVFSFELPKLPDGTLKLGDDFFDPGSSAISDPNSSIPIASLLKDGINKNKAFYKNGGYWYEAFKLDKDKFLNPLYALSSDEEAALLIGADRWFASGEAIEYVTPRAAGTKPILDINIFAGTEFGMPGNVDSVLTDGSTVNVPVEWDAGTPVFDKNVTGTYLFSGNCIFDPSMQKTPDFTSPTVRVIVHDSPEYIKNCDPNPNTPLSISAGTTIYGFDSLNDLQPSVSASYILDGNNTASGSASIKLMPAAPVILPVPDDPNLPQMEYYSATTVGSLGDRLKELEVMEFNIYKPVTKDRVYDYMVINFYVDDIHNVFFQTSVGNWELSPGWNKIRRVKEDFELINSVATMAEAGTMPAKTARGPAGQWMVLSGQVNRLNSYVRAKREKEPRLEKSMAKLDAGTPSWGNITCMELFVSSKVGESMDINLDRISLNPAGKAVVLFTFDDAWRDVLENGKPILDSVGFKATTWANKAASTDDYPSEDPREVFMNEADLDTIYDSGWDIGNHTVNHYDDIIGLTDEMIEGEYLENQQWILENGWDRGAYHVCYPSGQYDENLIQILEAIGAKSGRTTEYGIQPTPVSNIYKIKTVYISKNYPEVDNHLNNHVIPEIHRAVKTGSSLFFMLHRVDDDTQDDDIGKLAVSKEDFQKVVDIVDGYAKEGQLQVMTISEWYDAYIGVNQ